MTRAFYWLLPELAELLWESEDVLPEEPDEPELWDEPDEELPEVPVCVEPEEVSGEVPSEDSAAELLSVLCVPVV